MNDVGERGGSKQARKETQGSSAAPRTITVANDRLDSAALFGTSRQITIEHGSDTYILRVTAQNKLILTK